MVWCPECEFFIKSWNFYFRGYKKCQFLSKMSQIWTKLTKIISFILKSQTRPLFYLFQSLEYEFVVKGWNFWSRGSKSGNFWAKIGPTLDQIGQNYLYYPKEPSKATFFKSKSVEYEFVMKFWMKMVKNNWF